MARGFQRERNKTMNIQNQVNLVGYVAIDPRFKENESEDKAELFYTLAVNRSYKNKAGNYEVDYIPINVFGKQAVYLSKKLEKGTFLMVNGSIQMTKWTEGKKSNMYFYQHTFRVLSKGNNPEKEVTVEWEEPFPTIEPMDYLGTFND